MVEQGCGKVMDEALELRGDLYRILFARTRNRCDAEDLVQETYLRFHKRIIKGGFLSEGGVKRYLFKIAVNSSNQFFKRNKKRNISLTGGLDENLFTLNKVDDYKESLEFLQSELKEEEFFVLSKIVEFSPMKKKVLSAICNSGPEAFEEFRSKLIDIAEFYSRRGRIIIPKKEIASIKFNPLHIRFKSRDFNGDSLKFFRQYPEIYCDLSRLELSKFDQVLYNELRKTGKIGVAIPWGKKSYKSLKSFVEKHKQIVSAYKPSNASARAAAKIVPYSPQTILKHWKMDELEIRKNNGLLDAERNQIVGAYKECGRVVVNAARALKRSRGLVTKIWLEEGFEILPERGIEMLKDMPGQHCLSQQESQTVNDSFLKCSGVIRQASKLTGHCPKTIKKCWEKEGLINNSS